MSGLKTWLRRVKLPERWRIGRALYYEGGIGDELLCSAVAHELRRRGIGPIVVIARRPELFDHSPDVDVTLRYKRHRIVTAVEKIVLTPDLRYNRFDVARDGFAPPDANYIATMCRNAGITGEIELRPYITLTEAERAEMIQFKGYVAVQSVARGANYPMTTKEWGAERFAVVTSRLMKGRPVVQIGSAADTAVPCTVDMRGKTSLRQVAAILAQCDLYLGLEGFFMHLARAVDTPSVIVFGGRELPILAGYSCNTNLVASPPCSPCWKTTSCDFEMRCMTAISPEEVLGAVLDRLKEPRSLCLDKIDLDALALGVAV